MKITEPGVYYDIPNEAYHGDLCDKPSVSSSMGRTLMDTCPEAMWFNSYLNPEHVPENKKDFDLGHAAHACLLEPDSWLERIVEVDAKDYKTNAAKEARAAAWADDKTPLLPHHFDAIQAMREKLLAHPLAGKAWSEGHAEASYVWQDPGHPNIWLKCRVDFTPSHLRYLIDYKTTTNAHPRNFVRRVFDLGYFQSAAWYIDGVAAVTGKAPKEWWFVVQEVKPPHLVSVFMLDPRAIEWGRIMNRRAVALFARCVETGHWPGYGETAEIIHLPSWAEFQLAERHEAGEFQERPTEEMKRIAMEAQAP